MYKEHRGGAGGRGLHLSSRAGNALPLALPSPGPSGSPAHLGHVSGEPHCRGALARGVDAPRGQLVHVAAAGRQQRGRDDGGGRAALRPLQCTASTDASRPSPRHPCTPAQPPAAVLTTRHHHHHHTPEQLRLGHTGVAHQQHVDLSSGLGARQLLRGRQRWEGVAVRDQIEQLRRELLAPERASSSNYQHAHRPLSGPRTRQPQPHAASATSPPPPPAAAAPPSAAPC